MATHHSSRTPRTTTATDAVHPPRTDRGFAVFVAVSIAVAVTMVAPVVTAATVVGRAVTATTVAAVRSGGDRSTDPPDSAASPRQATAHAAD